jgi:hypothetical protein
MPPPVHGRHASGTDPTDRIGGQGPFWVAATFVFLLNAGLSALWGQWPLAGVQVVTALMAIVCALMVRAAAR